MAGHNKGTMIHKMTYYPRNWAKQLHDSKKRWMVLVMHRRAGKTTAVLNHLIRDAFRTPRARYAYIAPTYKQAKNVAWDIVKHYTILLPGIRYNEAELVCKFENGSTLTLYGSDNPDSLRGIALWGVGFDEYSQQPSNIFSEIISKCLADHLGYAIWLGTPKGKNEFYRVYQEGLKDKDNWLTVFKTIDESLAEESGKTIENLRVALEDDKKLMRQNLMTMDEFNQEWYCSFEAAIHGAYYGDELSKARQENRVTMVPYDPAVPVHTVWDLGVGQAMGIGFYQRVGVSLRMLEYWEGSNKEGLPEAIREVKAKPYIYGKHFAPHDIDATEIGTGKTRREIAKGLGIVFETWPRVHVDAGIAKGKIMWSHLWVDADKNQTWLDYIGQYRQVWDDKRGMFLKKPYHDFTSHAADVHRGAALCEDLMVGLDHVVPYVQPEYEPMSPYEG